VRDLAARLTADFARNLDRHLSGDRPAAATEEPQSLNGISLLIELLRKRALKTIRQLWK
jgi:aerobic carbon-monoxide dehydrogenase small subunit